MKITEIRDDLTNIRNMVEVCVSALLSTEMRDVNKVANVLFFHVIRQLEILDENLQEVKEK